MNETLKLIHIVLKVFLSVSIPPIFYRLGSQFKDFLDAIEFTERLKDIHFGDITKVFLP